MFLAVKNVLNLTCFSRAAVEMQGTHAASAAQLGVHGTARFFFILITSLATGNSL